MGRLIEQQAVIDCLTNTAKYYDMPQPDEWTKGIHYGLLHGVDNILDNVPIVETYTKADMVAMLENLDLQIDESAAYNLEVAKVQRLIRDKINKLKGEEDETNEKTSD